VSARGSSTSWAKSGDRVRLDSHEKWLERLETKIDRLTWLQVANMGTLVAALVKVIWG
jgi:hypothetical protein